MAAPDSPGHHPARPGCGAESWLSFGVLLDRLLTVRKHHLRRVLTGYQPTPTQPAIADRQMTLAHRVGSRSSATSRTSIRSLHDSHALLRRVAGAGHSHISRIRAPLRHPRRGLSPSISSVSEPEPPDEQVDQFIVYGAYGQVMHQFQVLELTLWGFLTKGIKRGMSHVQAMDKITKWDGTTLGQVVRGLKSQKHWPNGIIESLEQAVETRNYLAHHFLREYFVIAPSERVKKQATEQLAHVSARLEDLEEALKAHLRSLGVAGIEELDDEARAEIEKLRPKDWLDEPPSAGQS